jgi:hypothetical protein
VEAGRENEGEGSGEPRGEGTQRPPSPWAVRLLASVRWQPVRVSQASRRRDAGIPQDTVGRLPPQVVGALSDRAAFLEGGRKGLIPEELAASLADAAGLRNVLVHLYEDIEYEIVAEGVDRALTDFARFQEVYAARAEEEGAKEEGKD